MNNGNSTYKPPYLTILGGGPAGLAAGYYAKKAGLTFTVYEASKQVGGNCTTLKHGNFSFDTGAHRFHNKDAEVTREIQELLGAELERLQIPSQIYHGGKLIDFPLSPLNLIKNLGLATSAKAGLELFTSRLAGRKFDHNFSGFAQHTYGKTIANLFLLNYSEKLWGVSCDKLSPNVAGKRLKGLDLKTFLIEAILGERAKTEHIDGLFYYPKFGIGTIPEKLEKFCGIENVQKNSKITKVFHNFNQIHALELNHETKVAVDKVISTIPLSVILQAMEPKPVDNILKAAQALRYQNLILVAVFIDKNLITQNASVYFPESKFPFTRVSEPKNRSISMSPHNQTSLIAEIPCQQENKFWKLDDKTLAELVTSHLAQIGWCNKDNIIDTSVIRLHRAYPILESNYEENLNIITSFLTNFSNLKISGRNGKFMYSHIHDMMRFGKETVADCKITA